MKRIIAFFIACIVTLVFIGLFTYIGSPEKTGLTVLLWSVPIILLFIISIIVTRKAKTADCFPLLTEKTHGNIRDELGYLGFSFLTLWKMLLGCMIVHVEVIQGDRLLYIVFGVLLGAMIICDTIAAMPVFNFRIFLKKVEKSADIDLLNNDFMNGRLLFAYGKGVNIGRLYSVFINRGRFGFALNSEITCVHADSLKKPLFKHKRSQDNGSPDLLVIFIGEKPVYRIEAESKLLRMILDEYSANGIHVTASDDMSV